MHQRLGLDPLQRGFSADLNRRLEMVECLCFAKRHRADEKEQVLEHDGKWRRIFACRDLRIDLAQREVTASGPEGIAEL